MSLRDFVDRVRRALVAWEIRQARRHAEELIETKRFRPVDSGLVDEALDLEDAVREAPQEPER